MNRRNTTLRELWRFLRAEPEEIVLFAVIITGLVGTAAYRVFVGGETATNTEDIASVISSTHSSIVTFFNNQSGWGRVFLFGFWSIIGAVVYAIAWGIATLIVNLRKDLEVSASFTHPESFHNSGFWGAIIGRGALRVSAGAALIFYSIFWFIGFAPVWTETIQSYISEGVAASNIIDILLGLITVWLSLHFAAILLRLTLLQAHYKYDD